MSLSLIGDCLFRLATIVSQLDKSLIKRYGMPMTKKRDFTLATTAQIAQPLQHVDVKSRYSYLTKRMSAELHLRFLPLIFLLPLSNLALAQTLVIEINAVGLNENQSTVVSQLNQACDSLSPDAGDTGVQATELLGVCELINSLDENVPEELSRLQQIAETVAPEETFALNDSLSAISVYQTTNVLARLNALRNSVLQNDIQEDAQQSQSISDIIPGDNRPQQGGGSSADLVAPIGVFANGHTSNGEFDGGRLQQDTDIASNSLTIGADYRIHEKVVAGLGVGFLQDEANFTSTVGGTQSEGFNLTAFATWYETDQGYLDAVLDFGFTDYTLERSVSIDPDTSLIATSSPSATATSLTVSGGRSFKPFGLDLDGYFRLSFTNASIDRYSESLKVQQPGFAALFSIGNQSVVSTKMIAGLNLSKAFSFERTVLLPLLRIEYVTENNRKKDAIEATLIGTGTTEKYQGEDRDGAFSNLAIGTSALFRGGRSAYVFYETHLQHDVISQDWLKTGVRLEF